MYSHDNDSQPSSDDSADSSQDDFPEYVHSSRLIVSASTYPGSRFEHSSSEDTAQENASPSWLDGQQELPQDLPHTICQSEFDIQMLAEMTAPLALRQTAARQAPGPTQLPIPPGRGDIGQAVFSTFVPLVEWATNGTQCVGISDNWEDSSPLSHAIRFGLDDLVALLLTYGADPDARVGCYGRTALHQAVFYGRLSTIQVILDHGALVSVQDAGTLSPLHQALNQSKSSPSMTEIVRLLVSRDANVDLEDRFSRTPFSYLLLLPEDTYYRFPCHIYIELMYLFLQKSANTSIQLAQGPAFKVFLDSLVKYTETSGESWPHDDSPLCQAITLFLRKGADPNITLNIGESLLVYLLQRTPTSEQIQSLVRILCVHADVRARQLHDDGVLKDQRQILHFMASSTYMAQGLADYGLKSPQVTALGAS